MRPLSSPELSAIASRGDEVDGELHHLLCLAHRLVADNDDDTQDAAEEGCRLAADFLRFDEALRSGCFPVPRRWRFFPPAVNARACECCGVSTSIEALRYQHLDETARAFLCLGCFEATACRDTEAACRWWWWRRGASGFLPPAHRSSAGFARTEFEELDACESSSPVSTQSRYVKALLCAEMLVDAYRRCEENYGVNWDLLNEVYAVALDALSHR